MKLGKTFDNLVLGEISDGNILISLLNAEVVHFHVSLKGTILHGVENKYLGIWIGHLGVQLNSGDVHGEEGEGEGLDHC